MYFGLVQFYLINMRLLPKFCVVMCPSPSPLQQELESCNIHPKENFGQNNKACTVEKQEKNISVKKVTFPNYPEAHVVGIEESLMYIVGDCMGPLVRTWGDVCVCVFFWGSAGRGGGVMIGFHVFLSLQLFVWFGDIL